MNDVLKFVKKSFTVGVVATTIMWSVGASVLVAGVANATTSCPTVKTLDIVKRTDKPDQFVKNADGKYVGVMWGWTVKTWNGNMKATPGDNTFTEPDYLDVVSLTSDCYKTEVSNSYRNVSPWSMSVRPGTAFMRTETGKYYYITDEFTPKEITKDAADAIYGTGYKWFNASVYYWNFYSKNLESGKIVKTDLPKVKNLLVYDKANKKYYLVTDSKGNATEITSAGMVANRFHPDYAYVADATAMAKLTIASTTVSAKKATYTNLASGAEGTGTTSGSTGSTVANNLSVSLGASTASATTLVDGSQFNDMLDVNLKAGSSAVTVTGLTLTRGGYLDNANITGVSVWDGTKRLGNIMTALTSDGKVTVSFGNDKVVIPANSTKTLKVKANISDNANSGTVNFSVAAKTDVKTTGTVTVSGTFPITGNTMSIVDGVNSLGDIHVDDVAVAGLPFSGISNASGNLEVGDQQKEVGKFSIQQANSKEAVQLEKLTVYVEGTIQETTDLKNWKLYSQEGKVLATTTASSDRYVTFDLATPYKIDKGLTKNFSVKVDVKDGSSRYFRVSIQNDYDILVKGVTTGAYLLPLDSGGFSFDSVDTQNSNGYFKIKQGALTVTKKNDSPSTKLAPGSQNATLAKFSLKSNGEKIELQKMKLAVKYVTNALTGTVVVKDADTGVTYLSLSADSTGLQTTSNITSSTNLTSQNLSNYITIASGKTVNIEITGTLSSNATASDNYKAYVGAFYGKRYSTNDYTTLPNPKSVYDGNQLSVETVSLAVTKDASYGDNTQVAGATSVKLGQFVLKASSADKIKLTSITVGLDTGYASTTNLYLKDEGSGTLLGTTVGTPAAANSISVDTTVKADASLVLGVYGDIVAGTTGSVVPTIDQAGVNGYGVNSSVSLSATPASDVTGQIITIGSATLTVKADSGKPNSQILLAGSTAPQELSKINFEAGNDTLTLKKLTLKFDSASSSLFSTSSIAGNFKNVYLYDGSTKLAEGKINNNDDTVSLTGMDVSLSPSVQKVLTVKGDVSDSGTASPKSVFRVTVYSSSTSYMEVYSSTGLMSSGVTLTSNAAGNYMMITDSAPAIAWSGGASASKVGRTSDIIGTYTVTNSGTRPLTLTNAKILVSASGWANDDTGYITDFALYDSSDNQLGSTVSTHINTSTLSTSTEFSFSEEIPAGGSKTYTLKANTLNVRTGLAANENLRVTTQVTASKGYNANDLTGSDEKYWNDGTWTYSYTPSGASSAITGMNATDSGTVYGSVYTY